MKTQIEKLGFTLAEVLITLAIIGVVAAMTIPTLVTNYQDKVHVNKAKQAYSIMMNALNLYVAQNGCANYLCLFNTNKTSDEVAKEFATVLKTAKLCTSNGTSNKECESYAIKANTPSYMIDGKYAAGDNLGPLGRICLANGMTFKIVQNPNCIYEATYPIRDDKGYATGETVTYTVDRCAFFYIDTNGTAEPNQLGVDVFRFNIESNGSISEYKNYLENIFKTNKVTYTKYNLGDEVK